MADPLLDSRQGRYQTIASYLPKQLGCLPLAIKVCFTSLMAAHRSLWFLLDAFSIRLRGVYKIWGDALFNNIQK